MEIGVQNLPCPMCCTPFFQDVNFLLSTLIRVATTELNCPVCNDTVLGLDKFTIHLFTHTNRNESRVETPKKVPETNLVICDICNFTFNDPAILELHQKLLHQSTPDGTSGENSFHCHLCSKTFRMRGSLVVHLRVAHYGFFSEKKTRNEDDKQAGTSVAKADNKQWECDVCSKMFTTKYFLKKHKRLHTGEMPYSCSECKKSFTFQQSYHKHMLYHSSEKPHTCNECGRSFKELSTLQNHIRIHSGERPFACETCGKKFRQRVSYLVHRRIHTGVMPYGCTACGKKFRYKVSLRSHKCTSETNVPESQTQYQNDNVQCVLSVDPDGSISLTKKQSSNPMENKQNMGEHIFGTSNSTDLYSMMLSPLLPEVDSLHLGASENQTYFSENLFSDTTIL